jgi:alpha-ketoglutarate-dependent taurine dioxygenase
MVTHSRSIERAPASPALDWSLANIRQLEPDGALSFPLLMTPRGERDLARYLSAEQDTIGSLLEACGALLFRDFDAATESDFEAVARAACPELEANYGDLVKRESSDHVYDATWYPHTMPILFHNEGSHTHRMPRRQLFFCQRPSQRGGETPIVDCKQVYKGLRPALARELERRGLLYLRNFIPGIDVSWQKFFRTDRVDEVEAICRRQSIEFEWFAGGRLRIATRAPAVIRHPTAVRSFCNQIFLHHVEALDRKTSKALQSLFGPLELPRNVCFGDGEPIARETLEEIFELLTSTAVRFEWRQGDVLLLDNLAVAHARCPFEGERKILVALGDMVEPSALAG